MFEKLLKKIFDLNPTILQPPIIYIGNKYLNDTSKTNTIKYKMPYNPSLINRLKSDYNNQLIKNNPIMKRNFNDANIYQELQLTRNLKIKKYDIYTNNGQNKNKNEKEKRFLEEKKVNHDDKKEKTNKNRWDPHEL